MIEVPINYWAVLVAALSAIVVGSLWYGPLFGKAWMKLTGIAEHDMKGMKKEAIRSYFFMFIGSLVMSYVMAHFVYFTEALNFWDGAKTGLWIWIGFIATMMMGIVLWERKPFKLYMINAGYHLVELFVVGGILGVWQ